MRHLYCDIRESQHAWTRKVPQPKPLDYLPLRSTFTMTEGQCGITRRHFLFRANESRSYMFQRQCHTRCICHICAHFSPSQNAGFSWILSTFCGRKTYPAQRLINARYIMTKPKTQSIRTYKSRTSSAKTVQVAER